MFFNKRCGCGCRPQMNCCEGQPRQMDPIQEPTITNCVEREFYHEVPHE